MPNPLPDIGDIFKELVWDILVKALLARIFAAVPWLGFGPIGMIVGMFVTMFADAAYDALKLFIQMEAVPLKNEKHRQAFDKASIELKLIARDKGIDSPEFKAGREERKKRMSEFTQWAA